MGKYRIIEVIDSNKKDPYYYIEESIWGIFWKKLREEIVGYDSVYVLKTFISYEQALLYLDYINSKITKRVVKVVEKGSMVK